MSDEASPTRPCDRRAAWRAAAGAARARVDAGQCCTRVPPVARASGGALVALWGSDERDRDRGFALRVALRDGDGLVCSSTRCRRADARYPDLSPIFPGGQPHAARRVRPARRRAPTATTSARGCGTARWPIDHFPLRRDFDARRNGSRGQEDYPFVRVEGDGVHEIAGRARCTPASSSPGTSASRSSARRCCGSRSASATSHKGIEKRFEAHGAARRRIGSPAASRGDSHRRLCLGVRAGARSRSPALRRAAARRVAARAVLERERIANHLGDLGCARQRRRLRVRARAVLAAARRRAAAESQRRSAIGC